MHKFTDLHLTVLEENFPLLQGDPADHLLRGHLRNLRRRSSGWHRQNLRDPLHPLPAVPQHVPRLAAHLLLPVDRGQDRRRKVTASPESGGVGLVGVRGADHLHPPGAHLPLLPQRPHPLPHPHGSFRADLPGGSVRDLHVPQKAAGTVQEGEGHFEPVPGGVQESVGERRGK